MVKEFYQYKEKELSLNITNGEIDAVRKKNVTKSGCRVYENGLIGVAGTLGEPTQETWEKAERALQLQVSYPCAPTENLKRGRVSGSFPQETELIAQSERLLKILKEEFPEFVFSNKIVATEKTVSIENDLGLELEDVSCIAELGILVKEETSGNMFDSYISWQGREFDFDAVLAQARGLLRAHLNPVPMPQEKLPILMAAPSITAILGDYLHTQKLKSGAALLSGKEGTQVFSPNLTLCADRTEESLNPFFDAEGTTLKDDRLALIENGVLLRGITDKLCAAEFGQDLTACAEGEYDDVPVLKVNENVLRFAASGTLEEILHGKAAIFLCIAEGGDITPAGDFATPVQMAYLCKGGKLVGKLPEFSVSGNIFDFLGEGYLGVSSDRPFDANQLAVLQLKIEKYNA